MQAKSRSAADTAPRRAPRWILEWWLWLSTLAVTLASAGCPNGRLLEPCMRFANTVGEAFNLFPGTLVLWFGVVLGAFPAALAAVYFCTAGCHWLLRKLAPKRIKLLWFAALIVAWVLLSLATEFLSIWILFHRPPIGTMLIGALQNLFSN